MLSPAMKRSESRSRYDVEIAIRVELEVVCIEHLRDLSQLVVMHPPPDEDVVVDAPDILEAEPVPVGAPFFHVRDLDRPALAVLEPVLLGISIVQADALAEGHTDYVPAVLVPAAIVEIHAVISELVGKADPILYVP